ncbi:hypothetical protein CHS0354_026408 [Potamilus streckersoni]|uniref:Mitochondria-eating protein C-terminal domain-containing protein n=1 Tax=Potamilus streckersoni TaxID=2493646 RepID=A0AAE0W6G3_9BIVA|nr:hypothetical protein CHS0354_026408 [Potamilus streckersoni]
MASGQQSAKSKNINASSPAIDYVATILETLKKDSKYKKAAELAFNQWDNTLLEITKLRSKEDKMSSDKRIEREKEKDMRIFSLEQEVQELTRRLNTIAGNKMSDANPDITDLSDPYRPTKLAEMFKEVYNEEWTEAFHHYDAILKDEDKVLENLVFFPKDIYDFCTALFNQQSEKLEKHVQDMFSVMADPVFQIDGSNSVPVTAGKYINAQISIRNDSSPRDASKEAKTEARILIKQFQKTMTISSTSDLFELYRAVWSLKGKSEWTQQVASVAAIHKFVSKLLKLVWLMISQDPPICLKWLDKGTKVDKASFTFYTKSGDNVRRTIWPAVYRHANGGLMAKGVVQAN